MIVKEIRLKNYRKFKDARFTFKPGVNLITGPNGSGKTTIVEAIGFAVYGVTLTGLSLRSILHYDSQGQSDSGSVKLYLANSKKAEVIRELKVHQNIVKQKIILDGKEVTTSNINKIKKVFPDRELFYDIAFIDLLRHNLLDVNQEDFRNLLTRYTSTWDIQSVLDNSKSFHVYLRSREKLYMEKFQEAEKSLSKYAFLDEEIRKSVDKKEKLAAMLDMTERRISELRHVESEEDVNYQRSLDLLNSLQRSLEDTHRLLRRLQKNEIVYNEMEDMISDYWKSLAQYLNDYVARIRSLSREFEDLSKMLNNIIRLNENFMRDREKRKSKLLEQLNLEIEKRDRLTFDFERIVQELAKYEKQRVEQKQISKLLHEYKNSLEEYRAASRIEERLESIIAKFWRRMFTSFFLKVKDRTNMYLKNLSANMRVVVEEDKMKATIENEEADFELLSAGERELLNLLIKIAVLKELGENNILILEHPTAFLDQKRTAKVFSFLGSLKKDFAQTIITTVREDLLMEVDNKIVLN